MSKKIHMNKLFYIILFFILFISGCVKDPDLVKVQNLKGHNVKVVDKIFIYSQSDIDNNFKNADEVIIDKLWINKDGEYDFKNIIFSYSGKNKRCNKATSGFHPFIIIGGVAKNNSRFPILLKQSGNNKKQRDNF